jgi:protein required for attachment to host cells
MDNTWVLVANASRAHLYATERIGEKMTCLKDFTHMESRAKGSTLASDRPGHYQSKGSGRGSMGDPADPKYYEANRFAGVLASELNAGRKANDFRRLVLVAGSHFHGLLNAHLNEHTRAMVENYIHKDFTDCTERELSSRLKKNIPKRELPL